MKLLFIGLVSICMLAPSGFGQKAAPSVLVQWQNPTLHDFGDIPRGNTVSHIFEFKNVSNRPITIDSVRPACGCTTPEWPIEPIPAAGTDKIEVEFDAKNAGYFRKKIRVFFNGQRKPEILYLEGFVE